MITVAACDSLDDLKSLRSDWDDLLSRSDGASIFSTWEWVDASWRFSAPRKQPLVLLAREDGRLLGILPLAKTARMRILQTLEVMGCTANGYPWGDYGGPVVERGKEASVWAAFLRHMKSSRWSVIDLRNCMTSLPGREDQLANMYSQPASRLGWGVRVDKVDVCRRLTLPGTFDEYLSGLSSNGRQNIRRKLRKMAEAGLTIEAVDPVDTDRLNKVMQTLFEYHQAHWGDDPSGGAFPTEHLRSMHRYLAATMGARGKLDLRVARTSEGEIAGVIYNFRHNGVGYFYQLGLSQDPRS